MRLKFLLVLISSALLFAPGGQAKEYSIGTQTESKLIDAKVLESPAPEIPAEYNDEAFKTTCTARFNIDTKGEFSVKLLDSSGNEEIDKLILKTLKKWKFKAATLDDEPVVSTRKLKIELEVE